MQPNQITNRKKGNTTLITHNNNNEATNLQFHANPKQKKKHNENKKQNLKTAKTYYETQTTTKQHTHSRPLTNHTKIIKKKNKHSERIKTLN